MKKELLKFTAWVFTLVLIIVVSMSMTNCSRQYNRKHKSPSSKDSTVVKGYEKPADYQFLSVNELLEYKNDLISEEVADSVILYTPDPVLCNVCNVLLTKQSKFTKIELAKEYLANFIIYDNVTQNTSAYQDYKDQKAYTEIDYKDTVINGKRCEIVTKFY